MQVHKNTVDSGLDTNTVKNLIPSDRYIEANNVNLVSSGNFFALENIKGTDLVATVVNNLDTTVLAVFSNKYKIGNTSDIPCITIFSATDNGGSSTFNIWAYDIPNGVLYELYEESITSSYFQNNPAISGVLYPENGIDIIYFTDDIFEIRKLRCEIPVSYTPNFLTELDLKILQHGGNGQVALDSVPVGGSLFCGSYQIAYQLVNPETNQFTKFSLFCNPIQVYLSSPDSNNNIKSGVGLQSDKKIVLDITPSADELSYYTHFRLAVIENIEPSGVLVEKAQLTQLEEISDYLSGSVLQNVEYSANVRLESINLSDILVDRLALSTAKTLAVRQNRLVAGNITYRDLSYNNGTPAISSGSIIKQGSGTFDNMFSDPALSSRYRGYFRDEVYRFAISYFDEDGNFSYPSVLDLSAVTHNQITGAFKDMKFPGRDQNLGGVTYTLFKNGEGIQSLGLTLNGINNHPTWAKGFVILRAKRLKRVLFQTPLIPLDSAYGVGALEEYPYQANELSGTARKTVQYPNAQPMGPFTTRIPRNYLRLVGADITFYSVSTGATGGGLNKKFTGEAQLSRSLGSDMGMIFPPEYMYENVPYSFSPSHKLETVDAALVKGYFTDFSDINIGSTIRGRNIKTSVSGTFYALTDGYYYYNSTHSGGKPAIRSDYTQFTACEHFTNLGSGSNIGGLDVFRYDKLETTGFQWGVKANVQKCAAIKYGNSISDINLFGTLSFAGGTQVAKPTIATQDFYLVNDSTAHTIEIVNVISDLSDSRYGSYETPHDFIFTGTIVTFSSGELPTVEAGGSLPKNVDVWGGDCYVTPHLFKITDTSYGVSNSEKFESGVGQGMTDNVRNWEKSFNDDETANEACMSIPVAYKNAAQYIQVVLESEYNAGVIDTEIVNVLKTDGILTNKCPVYGLNGSAEGSCRVPMTYQLNHNHKKQNSDKLFPIKDPLLTETTDFGARFIYSDQKVYQTSIVGFDTFRVLNFYDLEETYGDITKLEVVGDDLYSLQEKAISYIGIGERTLETTDALTLAVQSGSFVGNVILVDNNKGCQHIRSVKNTGNALYFIDNINKSVNRLSGRQIDVISEPTVGSTFRTVLNNLELPNKLVTIYDPILKQLWFASTNNSNRFCYIFDEARNKWIGNYQFPANTLADGVYANQGLYVISGGTSGSTLATMYTGNRTYLFGTSVVPNVKFVVNPNMEIGKTFDDVLVMASERLSSLDVLVERESNLGNQTASGITLDVTTRGEGNYRAKILRDSGGARLRGPLAIMTLNWKSGSTGLPQNKVSSVLTKYRSSENRF